LGKVCICILHLKIRITEKLLKLEIQAIWSRKNRAVKKKVAWIGDFSNELRKTVSGIHLIEPNHRDQQGNVTKMPRVTGVVGGSVSKIIAAAPNFLNLDAFKSTPHKDKRKTLWEAWGRIIGLLEDHSVGKRWKELEVEIEKFASIIMICYKDVTVTPYIHILVLHGVELAKRFHDLNKLSQNGVERFQREDKESLS
jgi:hypothetical protein